MKKFSITLLLGLASLVFVMNGCKKVNCTELATEISNTALEYITNPSTANCEAYGDAIREYIDKCTISNKAYYDNILDDLDCGK
jgi:hypothetical protein